nr:MAG TPA: hypothetical protein [Caudoviricetes sp.]
MNCSKASQKEVTLFAVLANIFIRRSIRSQSLQGITVHLLSRLLPDAIMAV